MITDIPLVLRLQKNAPLTAAEVDNNFDNLRKAIFALSQQTTQRVVIGAEPPAGERDGVLWVPADYRAIYVWDTVNGKWVRMTEPTLYAVATSTNNAYEITLSSDIADLTALVGNVIAFQSQADNTGASTLKVNAFTAKPLKKNGAVDLDANQIKSGAIYLAVYDGVNFQILNPYKPASIFVNGAVYDENQSTGTPPTSITLTVSKPADAIWDEFDLCASSNSRTDNGLNLRCDMTFESGTIAGSNVTTKAGCGNSSQIWTGTVDNDSAMVMWRRIGPMPSEYANLNSVAFKVSLVNVNGNYDGSGSLHAFIRATHKTPQ